MTSALLVGDEVRLPDGEEQMILAVYEFEGTDRFYMVTGERPWRVMFDEDLTYAFPYARSPEATA